MLCSDIKHGLYSGSQRRLCMLSARCREPRPSQFSPRLQVRVISTSNIYIEGTWCCLHWLLGRLSTRVFETRTATGSELLSVLTSLQTTTFTLLSIFSQLEIILIKIWETPLSLKEKSPLAVAVRVPKTRVLKLPIKSKPRNPKSWRALWCVVWMTEDRRCVGLIDLF